MTDTIAQGVHHAADIITGHKMKTLAEGLGHKTQSTAGFEIDGIHTATGHPDPDLSGARLRMAVCSSCRTSGPPKRE